MADPIQTTWKLVDQFTKSSCYVGFDGRACNRLAKVVKEEAKSLPSPETIEIPEDKIYKFILSELMAASVNYCYWYGAPDIRPNGASASRMYKLLRELFGQIPDYDYTVDDIIKAFIRRLSEERFPLLEQRIKHLWQIRHSDFLSYFHLSRIHADPKREDLHHWLHLLITQIPGMASDLFLKRAFLFFIQLYREAGWFADDIQDVPIPADYHMPRILAHYGCIGYSYELENMIEAQRLIPSGSRIECEIRAQTLRACKRIAEKAEVKMCDVDTVLFFNHRKKPTTNFHLTVTTDY